MADHATNAFEVFSSQEKGHENHLTRALLVLLRLSPLSHEVWLRAIGLGDLGLTGVGEAQYRFQTSSLPGLQADQMLRGISVFISREPAANLGPIAESDDRRMIPDALVTYLGPDDPIVTVIESKVHAVADALQARRINLGFLKPKWDPPEPVALRWSQLIDDLWALIDADLAAGPEAALISDFFDFVDAHYRSVGPYSTLGRCGGIEERIRRRCRTVVEEATDKKAYGPSRGHGPYVEIEGAASLPRRVAFDHDEQDRSLRLSFWPADTPSQAHAFYSDHPLLQRIESMIESGHWKAVGNMHFGHFSAGYAWLPLPSDTSIEQYIAFWRDNVDLIATVYEPPRQPDWDNLLDKLEDERIASSRQPFEKDFMQTGRSKADVRPGVELYRSWPIEEAIDLDDRGELVGQVRDAFDLALKTFAG